MARIVVHPEQMRLAGQQWERTARELNSLVSRLSSAVGGIDWETRSGVDTVSARGAGAVQDTYTLVRKGIRKLLKAMG